MEYDDFALTGPKEVEQLARAYSNSLQKMGFMFVRINNENDERAILSEQVQTSYAKLKYIVNYLSKYLPNKYLEIKHRLGEWILDLENSLFDIVANFDASEKKISFNGLYSAFKILCQLVSGLGMSFISLKKYSSAFEQQKLEDLIYCMFEGLSILSRG